jgi:hypothetical protein
MPFKEMGMFPSSGEIPGGTCSVVSILKMVTGPVPQMLFSFLITTDYYMMDKGHTLSDCSVIHNFQCPLKLKCTFSL